jgi:hypothetical protein
MLDSDFGSEASDDNGSFHQISFDLESNNMMDLMNIDEDFGRTNGDTDDDHSSMGSDWSDSHLELAGTAGHYMDISDGSDEGSDCVRV